MSESKELVFNVDADTAEKVFSTPNGLQPYLDQSKVVINSMLAECGDVATAKGRAAYKSLARKVASLKNKIDGIGKDLVAELKEKPKRIDAERKRMRDMLEAWQTEISEPVEAYEAEEQRKAEELAAKLEAEKLAAQIEQDHEFALLLNAEFDRKRAEELAAAELARAENERRIAEAAAAQAKADAERAAEEASRRAQEAIEAEKMARVKAEQDAEAERVKAIKALAILQALHVAQEAHPFAQVVLTAEGNVIRWCSWPPEASAEPIEVTAAKHGKPVTNLYRHPSLLLDRLNHLADGLDNARNNADDAYNRGYLGAMLEDVEAMIKECGGVK